MHPERPHALEDQHRFASAQPNTSEERMESASEQQRERFQGQFFDLLTEWGMLERREGLCIVDLPHLMRDGARLVNNKHLERPFPNFARTFRDALMHAFYDQDVVSRRDWDEAHKNETEITPRPLVYQPADPESAFDPDAIKDEEFYIAPWDLRSAWKDSQLVTSTDELIDAREASIALMVYHPDCGNGYRDKDGTLYVWWPSYEKFRPISSNWFQDEIRRGFGKRETPGEALSTPKEFLRQHGQELIRTGALMPEDFRAMSDKGEKIFRSERRISPSGTVMLDGVSYFVGRGMQGAQITKLSPDIAAVIAKDPTTGDMQITHTFPLRDRADASLPIHSVAAGGAVRRRTNLEQTQLAPFRPEEFEQPRSGEHPEDTRQRLTQYERLEQILEFSRELSERAGVNLSLLNFENQSVLSGVVEQLGSQRERLIQFVQRFGMDGLKSFIAASADSEHANTVLALGERLSSGLAKEVFADYAQLVDFIMEFDQTVGTALEERLPDQFQRSPWYRELFKRAKEYLQFVKIESVRRPNMTYDQLKSTVAKRTPLNELSRCYDAVIWDVAVTLANHFGTEEIRDILSETDVPKADEILQIINPEQDAEILHSLRELYDRILFETYSLNEKMTFEDTKFLKAHVAQDDRVLDLGCGTGRHLEILHKAGYAADGLDFVSRHAKRAKDAAPKAGVVVGDWTNTPFRDQAYDAVYSLGRSLLHEFQPHRQLQVFQEANRLLPVGGKFLLDIPDRNRGVYKKLAESYAEKMQDRGITNFRHGTIYDSPDGENFYTRYAYAQEDIQNLAHETGFEIESVTSRPLKTDKGDMNLYYTLKKIHEVEKWET